MPPDTTVQITETVAIPLAELHFQFSRSGGPGGQHVNRTASQVELTFDVLGSPSLSERQRTRALTRDRMDSSTLFRRSSPWSTRLRSR